MIAFLSAKVLPFVPIGKITGVIAHIYNDIIFFSNHIKARVVYQSPFSNSSTWSLSTDGNPSSLKFCIVTSRFTGVRNGLKHRRFLPRLCTSFRNSTAPGMALRFALMHGLTPPGEHQNGHYHLQCFHPSTWYYPLLFQSASRTIAKGFL